ncbi:MAG TPA: alpha/beta hydrolase [Fimbriimonas sp.]|nr:alpha/beta hydrolase [Fimbriimonas sp.]
MTTLLALTLSLAVQTPQTIPLWPNGAPGFESRRNEPEQAKDWWVKNIHNPSITAFLPAQPTGCGVVICPGGGLRELVYNAEGVDAAKFLNSIGVAAFVLKYRLPREESSPYNVEVHPRQDGQRALRLIRNRAKDFGIDANRLGMLGFSAGGEVVAMCSYGQKEDPKAPDPIDQLNGRPSFSMYVYPGPLGMPVQVPADAPPAFMVVANDDYLAPVILDLMGKYRAAKVPFEAHIFQQGNHAFNMGQRTTLQSVKGWPQRMAEWLGDSGWLKARTQ